MGGFSGRKTIAMGRQVTFLRTRDWHHALLDLDGTLYSGNTVLPGAANFVDQLRRRKIQPVFFTNNASRTPEEVALKLCGLGIQAGANEVCTAAQSAAAWIRKKLRAGALVAYVGTKAVETALEKEQLVPVYCDSRLTDLNVDAMVVGMDPMASYGVYAQCTRVVAQLGWWVLTNADVRLPSDTGFLPGNGAVGSLIQTTTGIEPVVTGKPEPWFVSYALERVQGVPETTFIVGDNVRTDILAGKRSSLTTVHVQTGVGADASFSEALRADVSITNLDEFVEKFLGQEIGP